MPILLQISIEVNSGSVGRIAEQIGEQAIRSGWSSYITYARNHNPSSSNIIKIGTKWDVYSHGLETRLFDNHGFGSRSATIALTERIREINPDIIHLHHLHGYFINIEILFRFLKESGIPVVWTFHDCWAFTGHCAYFEYVGCEKWKTGCYACEQKKEYPKSLWADRSVKNYADKKRIFNSLDNLTLIPVSHWLGNRVSESFLAGYPMEVIHNGVDLSEFYPKNSRSKIDSLFHVGNRFIILGVASTWDRRKGLDHFVQLYNCLDPQRFSMMLVGLSPSQIRSLPPGIVGLERTESVSDLADLYSAADVFVNTTLDDTFPTVNLEALACGTPVITYRSGGSPESISSDTGVVLEKGDVEGIVKAIVKMRDLGSNHYVNNCRESAVANFENIKMFGCYMELYNTLLNEKVSTGV
ncbi:glycosyltransferase [Chryseobacterium sp.]|uniref:glycosyltransferase n=1 Tax=Chryseobacterium sp. TaxID=1871047 RepID=UPI0012A8585D|nr:glycosyltransferase [Chryseobacterium sp.]QFG53715.1 glycosyltransferase [Chryseobacterium sp.]